MEWFRCSERLPDKEGLYFVCSLFCNRPSVTFFTRNLEKVDSRVFSGKNRPGFYSNHFGYPEDEVFEVEYWSPYPSFIE